MSVSNSKLLRVGELAKCTGKTVRAIHLYEELGLLRPAMRSEGGFRLYQRDAVTRIDWVVKLQAIGFTLSEIQDLVKEFEGAPCGRDAAIRARAVFAERLSDIRQQIARLQAIESDLVDALGYLDVCQDCSPAYRPTECSMCSHQGHERDSAPPLFANLSRTAAEECGQPAHEVAIAGPGEPLAGTLPGARADGDAAEAPADADPLARALAGGHGGAR
jgi:MerR family copper efflux transcriptional regulator